MTKPGDEPIPGYRLETLLGRGQFGQVWRARSPGNTTLALKFLELTGVHGWKEFRAVQRVKQIRHAHLMPIVALWLLDEEGRVISDDVIDSLAAEHPSTMRDMASAETLVVDPIKTTKRPAQLVVATLLANQTLGDRLRECRAEGRQGIPTDELLRYMDEAAKGLDFLNLSEHRIGESLGAVQHCDVKPENIMLAGGSVVISDFGVSQALAQTRQAATGTSLGGTPAYMAPECFANKPCKATDQYSLAVTYYELRTGALPFQEHTYAAVYRAHHEGKLDFAGCSAAEQRALRKATALDPSDRFATCKDFVDELRQAFQPEATPEARAHRKAWLIAAATLAVLAAGLAAAAVYYYRGSGEPAQQRTRLAAATIVVDPADALVTVDGKSVSAEPDGRVVVHAEIGSSVLVKASKPPERLDASLAIDALEPGELRRLSLPYSAAYFAAEANRLFDAGRADEAAAALKEAIVLEPDRYARAPAPAIMRAGDAAVEHLALARAGDSLASGSSSGRVQRWSLAGGLPAAAEEAVHQAERKIKEIVLTADAVAALSWNGAEVAVSLHDGSTTSLQVPGESGTLERIALAGDRWLVAAAEALAPLPPEPQLTVLYAWDLQAADIAASRREVLRLVGEIEPRLAAAHHGSWVMISTTDGATYRIRLCTLEQAEPPAEVYTQAGEVVALATSPDDRWVALGGGAVADDPEGNGFHATVIDVRTRMHQTLSRGHADTITAIAFAAQGELLCTGSSSGEVHAWSIQDWDAAQPLLTEPAFMQAGAEQRLRPVTALYGPPGGAVVCRHEDQVVVWDLAPPGPASLLLPSSGSEVTACVVTQDAGWLVTGHADGTVRCWPLPRLLMVMRACRAAGTPVQPPAADQVTRCDRSARPVACFPGGSAGTERLPWNRSTVVPVG